MDDRISFDEYWKAIAPAPQYENRKTAAELEWNAHPEKHKPIMAWLRKHGAYPERNPYFFIHDFTVSTPSHQPEFLRGDEGGDLVQVKYNGMYKICTRETMQMYHLEFVKNWN